MGESVVHNLLGTVLTNDGSDAPHVLGCEVVVLRRCLHVEVEDHACTGCVRHIHASPTGHNNKLLSTQAYYLGLCNILVAPSGLAKCNQSR